LSAEGALLWTGVEAIGPDDGRIAFYGVEQFSALAPPARPLAAEAEVHRRIRDVLRERGACFFAELARRVGGFEADALEALWDLVWAGEVTNDTLSPLRSRLFKAKAGRSAEHRRAVSFRARQAGPPGSEGRWSLLVRDPVSPTLRGVAASEMFLSRFGVVTRDAVRAEGIPGGFAAIYPILREREERGQVRRGYFVAGLGAAQFAEPGADDRLRALREPEAEPVPRVLAASDPANPYGAAVPWGSAEPRPQRAAGARVVLFDGAAVLYLARGERTVQTFLPASGAARDAAISAAAKGLASLVDGVRRRALLITKIDGADPAASPLAAALAAVGFTVTSKGLLLRSGGRLRS
jgi:ATP-dependent Lhr-like helicase